MATAIDLAAKKKAAEDAMAEYEAAVKLTHAEDLKTVKELIARHSFTAADLKPELKIGRAPAKRSSTPRKSTRRSKK
jgi:hypothetical protein